MLVTQARTSRQHSRGAELPRDADVSARANSRLTGVTNGVKLVLPRGGRPCIPQSPL